MGYMRVCKGKNESRETHPKTGNALLGTDDHELYLLKRRGSNDNQVCYCRTKNPTFLRGRERDGLLLTCLLPVKQSPTLLLIQTTKEFLCFVVLKGEGFFVRLVYWCDGGPRRRREYFCRCRRQQ